MNGAFLRTVDVGRRVLGGNAQALVWLVPMVILVLSCAKRGAPGGGPKDETPPFVSRWYPATGSGGVDGDLWVEIEWNEPIERGSVEENLLVSPDTSVVERKWENQQLRLRPRAGWISGITHWIWVRRGIVDRHDLISEEPFGMWFSTGDSLPSATISGSVWLGREEPAVDATVMATGSDSALVWVTPSDQEGAFIMPGLEPGRWRLEAFLDIDGDGRYRFGSEPWGADTLLLPEDSTVTAELFLAVMDTTPPVIYEAIAVHRGHVRLVFSEPMFGFADTSFSLVDTMGEPYTIANAYASFLDPAIVHLYLDDPLRDDRMDLSISNGEDSVGLPLADTTLAFLGTSLADTVPPLVQSLFYSAEKHLQLGIAFSEPVHAETVHEGFQVSEVPGCRPVMGSMEWLDPSLLWWTADDTVQTQTRFLVALDEAIIDFSGLHLKHRVMRLVPAAADTIQPPWEQRILVKREAAKDSVTLIQFTADDSS